MLVIGYKLISLKEEEGEEGEEEENERKLGPSGRVASGQHLCLTHCGCPYARGLKPNPTLHPAKHPEGSEMLDKSSL